MHFTNTFQNLNPYDLDISYVTFKTIWGQNLNTLYKVFLRV